MRERFVRTTRTRDRRVQSSLSKILAGAPTHMTNVSREFERQVEKIHSLIQDPEGEVTWDDRIQDPDNPQQQRQIDISIKRDGFLTIVECRIHRETQDVTWIEELIGRRASLRADVVIAVSASGFTSGAILKAKAYGIILRDVISLTEEEIRAWGKRTDVKITFHRIENVKVVFEFPCDGEGKISINDIENQAAFGGLPIAALFDKAIAHVKQSDPALSPQRVAAGACIGVKISGIAVRRVLIEFDFSAEYIELSLPSVVAYDTPGINVLERNAYVEQVERGGFSITQSSDIVSVAMDLTLVPFPTNCKFGGVSFKFSRPVDIREVTLLKMPDLGVWLSSPQVGLRFV